MANHSARKTAITALLDENVNLLHVKQVSGHKKLDSLTSYNVASNAQQKEMPHILSATKSDEIVKHQSLPRESNNQILPSTFHCAQMNNCIFNINVYQNNASCFTSPVRKRKRIFIEDDSQ